MSSSRLSKFLALALFALFIAAAAISLAAGSQAYKAMEQDSESIKNIRISNGAISNIVRSLDTYAAFEVGQGPEGQAIVLLEPTTDGVFENRIYLYDGHICLETAPANSDYDPSFATQLMESDIFDFTVEGDLLTVTTDEGTSMIALRSGIAGETGGLGVEDIEVLDADEVIGSTEVSQDVTVESDSASDTYTIEQEEGAQGIGGDDYE